MRAGFAYRKKPERREYVRVRLDGGTAQKFPRDGAGILSSMVAGNCLIVLDEGRADVAAGELVTVEPF